MSARQSRVYRHLKCKGDTEVSGGEFAALADPLAAMETTYCSTCDEVFTLDEFMWADSEEVITDYYKRHGKKATDMDRSMCSNQGLAVLAAAGAMVGIVIGAVIYMMVPGVLTAMIVAALAFVGAVAGGLIREMVVSPAILKKVSGVSDPRELV